MCGYHRETERERLEKALKRLEAREWCEDANVALAAARKHLATMPKPARKVKVAAWAMTDRFGGKMSLTDCRDTADSWRKVFTSGFRVVELTGEYEE